MLLFSVVYPVIHCKRDTVLQCRIIFICMTKKEQMIFRICQNSWTSNFSVGWGFFKLQLHLFHNSVSSERKTLLTFNCSDTEGTVVKIIDC